MTDYGELVGYVGLVADYNNDVTVGELTTGVSTTPGWRLARSWPVISLRPSITAATSPARSTVRTSASTRFASRGRWVASASCSVSKTRAIVGAPLSRPPTTCPTWSPRLRLRRTSGAASWRLASLASLASAAVRPGASWAASTSSSTRSRLVTCCASRAPTVTALTPYKTVTTTNDTWSVYAGLNHYWTPMLSSGFDATYVSTPSALDLGLGLRRQPGLGSGLGLQRETAGRLHADVRFGRRVDWQGRAQALLVSSHPTIVELARRRNPPGFFLSREDYC